MIDGRPAVDRAAVGGRKGRRTTGLDDEQRLSDLDHRRLRQPVAENAVIVVRTGLRMAMRRIRIAGVVVIACGCREMLVIAVAEMVSTVSSVGDGTRRTVAARAAVMIVMVPAGTRPQGDEMQHHQQPRRRCAKAASHGRNEFQLGGKSGITGTVYAAD